MRSTYGVLALVAVFTFSSAGCLSGGLVQSAGPRVVHESSQGKVTVNFKFTEKDLGVPFYPGAKPLEGGGGGEAVTAEMGMMIQSLSTPDSMDKVVAFYTSKLGAPTSSGPGLGGGTMAGWDHTHPNGTNQNLMVMSEGDKGPVSIMIMVFTPGQSGIMPGQ